MKGALMQATISKWGNSQGLRFPKDVMKELHLSIGDKVRVFVENKKIILEPISEIEQFDIHELVQQIPADYKPLEVIDDQLGKEEW